MSLPRAIPALVAAAALALSGVASATAGAALTAEQIVQQSADRRSVGNSVQTMTMQIFDKAGRSKSRTIESKVKRGADGRTKSYVRFTAPADEAGIQFLTVENPTGEDDQFLYMPEIGSNRIAGAGKKGAFAGSDFTYEDLSVGQVDDGTHTLKGDETITIGGQSIPCYVVESVPKAEIGSAYTRIVSYIEKSDLMPRQVLFFNSKGENSKKMSILEVTKDGSTVVPTKTLMEDLKKGTKTEVVVSQYRLNVPASELPDSMFTEEFLKSEG